MSQAVDKGKTEDTFKVEVFSTFFSEFFDFVKSINENESQQILGYYKGIKKICAVAINRKNKY